MVGAIAAGTGFVVRALLATLRALPGIMGPLLLVYGCWLLHEAAGYIVAGVVLWLADIVRGLPARPAPDRGTE